MWSAPLAGAGFVLLLAAWAVVIGGKGPRDEESAGSVARFYVDNDTSATFGWRLFGLAALALLFFVGVLSSELRLAEGRDGWLASVALGGGVVAATGMLTIAGCGVVLANVAGGDLDGVLAPVGVQTIHVLARDLAVPTTGGMAALLLASAVVIIRGGALRRPLGWAAVVLALGSLTPAGFAVFLASSLWILVVAVVIALDARADAA